ncbi:MAG: hypothetical protein J7621_17510 [Niastella sp.]|nr:hypothetical protein [Niastella sp.]
MVRLGTASKNILVFTGSLLFSMLLYYPVLNNTFLSDDYDSLYRITIRKDILFKDFLRPLIDLSFYLNYSLSGLNAISFYIFNILIHAVNVWLLYRVALRFEIFDKRTQATFAGIVALLFLVYPFHSESIVWLSARLSSLACLCALIALHVMLGNWQPWKKRLVAFIVYFIGLHAYESILLLPLIIIAWQWRKGQPWKKLMVEGVFWGAAILLYLVWRLLISGVVYNNYSEHVVNNQLIKYLSLGLKTLGRSVLPPQENSQRMVVLFSVVTVAIGLVHYLLFRKMRAATTEGYRYLQLGIAFLIAILIPVLFGVSTRTTEGDRLLYFPSCFLCMMLGFLMMVLIRKSSYRWGIIILLSAGAIYLTIANNKRWEQASGLVEEVHEKIQQANGKKIVLINLPEEMEGAFVFRNGFYNSLLVYGVDTASVTVSHYLKRTEYLTIKDTIPVNKENGRVFIYPATYLIDNQNGSFEVRGGQNEYLATVKKDDNIIYYWNNRELVKLF